MYIDNKNLYVAGFSKAWMDNVKSRSIGGGGDNHDISQTDLWCRVSKRLSTGQSEQPKKILKVGKLFECQAEIHAVVNLFSIFSHFYALL